MFFSERIDTHAHFLPPFYRQACEENGHVHPDGMPAVPEWSEEGHLALMKRLSISKSILSISSPGTYLTHGDLPSAKTLTRQCNEYAAALVSNHPNSFGFWASLPLPDIPASLDEVTYVLDTLHATGITLETNHHGIYLGDPKFDPLFTELNRRHATVFIHPTTPCLQPCSPTSAPTPATPLSQYPSPMMEFMFDSARAVINLFLSGTIARCPNIIFIIPHAGATLPPLIDRFAGFASLVGSGSGGGDSLTSGKVKEVLAKQFYFDLAGMAFPDQVYGLLRFVGKDRLLYGSDYPFTPEEGTVGLAKATEEEIEEWEAEDRRNVLVSNAKRLLKM